MPPPSPQAGLGGRVDVASESMTDERRRAPRYSMDVPGELVLSGGRRISVRIVNIGQLGALVSIADLEVAILAGERAALTHPQIDADGKASDEIVRTAGAVVRVDLDFADAGVSRHMAMYFDGGAEPD